MGIPEDRVNVTLGLRRTKYFGDVVDLGQIKRL